jgi:hypothetical protein
MRRRRPAYLGVLHILAGVVGGSVELLVDKVGNLLHHGLRLACKQVTLSVSRVVCFLSSVQKLFGSTYK